MALWRFGDPADESFARASLRGTWADEQDSCPECTSSGARRIQPLILEWEPGSDVVGDFVWAGFDSDAAVTAPVMEAFAREGVVGWQPGPVEMIQDPKLVKPRKPNARTQERVWLPYEGPEVHDLWVVPRIGVDRERSRLESVRCSHCGRERFAVEGIERLDYQWDPDRSQLVKKRWPRVPGRGLIVEESRLPGPLSVFRTVEFPSWICCTDGVKAIAERAGLQNLTFLEIGDVVGSTTTAR